MGKTFIVSAIVLANIYSPVISVAQEPSNSVGLANDTDVVRNAKQVFETIKGKVVWFDHLDNEYIKEYANLMILPDLYEMVDDNNTINSQFRLKPVVVSTFEHRSVEGKKSTGSVDVFSIGVTALTGEKLSANYIRKFSLESISNSMYIHDPRHKKWGEKVLAAIDVGGFFIGMTKEQVRISLGPWKKVNSTVTAKHRMEQIIYDNLYLYFDNGVLRSFQKQE